ncbi:MAG: hypothetical protein MUF49_04045 [Oculatellaceae cyanobacterium Prado106]|nr:hypothetical protein [Oculatellaceae cyanobacterium Prado106]
MLVVPLALYTAYSGFVVGELEMPGGFRIVFREKSQGTVDDRIDDLPKEELERRQAELEERFRALEQKENQSPIPPQAEYIDLNGIWYGHEGLTYQIVQNGNLVAIQEISPLYGITAVGQGQIQGQSVLINYQTASFTQGVANLTLSSEGRSLTGTFQDMASGFTVPAVLNR